MQPEHQRRVLTEQSDLAAKIEKLGQFIASSTFAGLPVVDQDLLCDQHDAMQTYETILQRRIARF